VSLDGNIVYVHTNLGIMAKDIRNNLIWSLEKDAFEGFEYIEMKLSHDGCYLYVMDVDFSSNLYRIETSTGIKEFLYKAKLGRTHRLIGTNSKGKICIQSISY
jgi:hypothetical protein